MNPPDPKPVFAPTLLALSLLAAFGAARAQDSTAEGSVTAGVGLIAGDNAERSRFGQYNGLRTHSGVGLFDASYGRRNETTGVTTRFEATSLLTDTRELDFRWGKQGDWKFSARYDEKARHDPNTASSGAELKLKRTEFGVGFAKIINPRLQLDVSLSSENKDGARLFGIGMTCPSAVAPGCGPTTGSETGWAILMLPEPINANHSQAQARISYAGDKLRLSAGYHGSFYRNAYGSLNPSVPATLNNPLGTPLPLSAGLQGILNQPVALPPDNQAHHFDVAGTYAFTPKTRGNFKLGFARALQHQNFAASGFSAGPAGVNDLGGKVDTTMAQLGLTSRPLRKLSLVAKLRYEDKDDRTPIALYNIEGTSSYTNRRLPRTKLRAQAQANYQFSSDYRGTLGLDHEAIDRGVFTATSAVAGISALRQKTDETTLRGELRRRMSESFSGSVVLAHSRRDGSNWLRDNSGLGVTEVPDPSDPSTGFATAIFMPTLADRERNTLKLLADWQASESLSLQLSAQRGRDRFKTPSAYGLRHTGTDQLNLDANYALSDDWSVNGFVSYGDETLRQARPGATELDFDNVSTTVGVGVVGRPISKLQLGGNLLFVNDRSVYAQTLDPAADGASAALLAATGGLPDIVFRQFTLKLFGRYELNKQSAIRLELIHQRSKWTDWAWGYNGVPFTYSDGTTVMQQPVQTVTFIGVAYIHRWP